MDLEAQLSQMDDFLLRDIMTEFPNELTDEEKARSNAYLVLAHAILEEYIEDAFKRHYDTLCGWLSSVDLVPVELVRLAFAAGIASKGSVGAKVHTLEENITAFRANIYEEVRKNNGVKSSNLKKLAAIGGLDYAALEAQLATELIDLESLGSKRGDAGHLSPYTEKALYLTRTDYPENVREWVDSARLAAVSIARYLEKLLRQQTPKSILLARDGN